MNQGKILKYENLEKLTESLVSLIKSIEEDTPMGEFMTLALSGGSSPKNIYNIIIDKYSNKIDWSRIKLFWVDERCVSPQDDESNYKMTRIHLLDKTDIPSKQIFRIFGEHDPEEEAKRYGGVIADNLPIENGLPKFDLILLGIGTDGHTASIFPGNYESFNSVKICETAVHPVTKQNRVTITGKVINNAKNVVFIVTGSEKSEILTRILNDNFITPASSVMPQNGNLFWMLDKTASELL